MEEKGEVPSLLDMQWQFGVTTSNDELKVVGKCFVQIKLLLNSGPLYLEMSAPEFLELLSGLEKLNIKLET